MAQSLKNEANIDAESYDQAIAEARTQARKSIQQTTKEMSIEASRQQEELGKRLSEELKSAEEQIKDAKTLAVKNIHKSAASLSSKTVKLLIGEELTEKTINDSISSAISGINEEANK